MRSQSESTASYHGDVEELALAGALGVPHRGNDAERGERRRVDVADAGPGLERPPVGGAGDAR